MAVLNPPSQCQVLPSFAELLYILTLERQVPGASKSLKFAKRLHKRVHQLHIGANVISNADLLFGFDGSRQNLRRASAVFSCSINQPQDAQLIPNILLKPID